MTLTIDRIDLGSDRDLCEAAALETEYLREALAPDEPEMPPTEMLHAVLRVNRPDIEATGLLARDGGRAVGLAIVDIRSGHGNEHMAWVPILYVHGADRRQGVGTHLLGAVIEIAGGAGRRLVLGSHPDGHAAGRSFAAAAGATAGHAERQNRLRLADVDRGLMQRWIDDAAHRAVGHSLVGFDDHCPDELLDSLVRMQRVMNTAPRSAALDDFEFTAEHRRAAEVEQQAEGTHQWVLFARDERSGDAVGYTELVFRPHRPWLVEQGDTAVDPAHRNRGLGRWLKAVNVLRLLDQRPDARVVETWNDGTNGPMLRINDEMGFRVVATWREVELTIG